MHRDHFESASFPTASKGWGKVMFSVCSYRGGGGGTLARSRWGRGYPKVPTPSWPGQDRGRGYPKVLTPPPAKLRTPQPCQGSGEGLPQGTYLPTKVGTPWDRTAYGVLDLLRSVASCVHAGGLSCLLCFDFFKFE